MSLPSGRPEMKALVEGAPLLSSLPDRLRGVLAEIIAGDEASMPGPMIVAVFGPVAVAALVEAGLVEVWKTWMGDFLTLTPVAAYLIGVELAEGQDYAGDGLAAEPYWVPRGTPAPRVHVRGQRGSVSMPFANLVPDRALRPPDAVELAEEIQRMQLLEHEASGEPVKLWGMTIPRQPKRKTPKGKAKRRKTG